MAMDTRRDLTGLVAFSREGTKLGKVKRVIRDPETAAEYLVVGRFLSHDLIVPADAVDERNGSVVVPFSSSYLDMAPALKVKNAMSQSDRARLDEFFHSPVG